MAFFNTITVPLFLQGIFLKSNLTSNPDAIVSYSAHYNDDVKILPVQLNGKRDAKTGNIRKNETRFRIWQETQLKNVENLSKHLDIKHHYSRLLNQIFLYSVFKGFRFFPGFFFN